MSERLVAANWIKVGLWLLPVYGLLTFWSTLHPQPNQTTNPDEWARFVGSNAYLVDHIFGAIGGAILAILGVFALGTYLATSRAGSLGLAAMIMTVVGQAMFLAIGGVATFATNAVGRAYLAGLEEVMQLEFHASMTVLFTISIALALFGNVLLGVAVWRSGTLPRWTGAIWAAAAVLFYVLGAVLGMMTTGSSLITQPLAALMMVLSGAWMAWTASTAIYGRQKTEPVQ